jgi:hypothetical protein
MEGANGCSQDTDWMLSFAMYCNEDRTIASIEPTYQREVAVLGSDVVCQMHVGVTCFARFRRVFMAN